MLYICTSFAKVSQRVSELQTQTLGLTLGWLQVLTYRWTYKQTENWIPISHHDRQARQKADNKIFFSKFSKNCLSKLSYQEFKNQWANSVGLDEVAHNEPPHQDLCCLQIQLFSYGTYP